MIKFNVSFIDIIINYLLKYKKWKAPFVRVHTSDKNSLYQKYLTKMLNTLQIGVLDYGLVPKCFKLRIKQLYKNFLNGFE